MITFNPSRVHPFQKLSLMQNPVAINFVCICALVSGIFSISQHVQQFGTFSRPSRLIQHWQPKKQLINCQFSTGSHFVPYIFGDSCQQHGLCTTLGSWIQPHFCEKFTVMLMSVLACDFKVILHKDDTHKSNSILWQFHSIMEELPMNLRPFYGSKEPQLHCTCFFRMVAEPGVARAWLCWLEVETLGSGC